MEIALGIVAILLLDLLYLVSFKGIDYSEKGSYRKTYQIGFWKYFMIRYTKKIELSREEELRKKGNREKDLIHSSTISVFSFWLQIGNFILVTAIIILGILDVVLQNSQLENIVKIARIIFVVLGFLMVIFSIAKSERMLTKRTNINSSKKDK